MHCNVVPLGVELPVHQNIPPAPTIVAGHGGGGGGQHPLALAGVKSHVGLDW